MPSDAAVKQDPKAKGAEAPAEKPKRDILSLALFGVVVINSILVGALAYLLTQFWGRLKDLGDKTTQIEKAQISIEAEKIEEPPAGKEFQPKELGVLYPLEGFLVNIASDRGPRFLQMQVELELENPALEDEIALKRPAIRDAIILLLSSKSYKELRDPSGMQRLRTDLLKSINGILKSGNISDIFFTQFHFN